MKDLPYLSRHARWAVPAAIVAAAGGLLAGPVMSGPAAAPRLPARSAGQLLAAVTGTATGPPLAGTITETASLGLPALPEAGALGPAAPVSAAALLAGSNTVQVWYSDPEHFRLALPQSMSEDDLVRNGTSAWLWDSASNSVTHLTLPASAPVPATPAVPLTPQQAAQQALAAAGPASTVRVDRTVTVAGRAAYQLVLAPRSHSSLIGQVRIAIDSQYRVPLRVQVFARGAASPAAEVGFTAISFTPPPAADYAFTPPPGATVTQQHAGAASAGRAARQASGTASGLRVIGTGWLAVAALPESSLASPPGGTLPGGPGGGLLPFRYSGHSQAPGESRSPGGRPGPPAGAPGPLPGALLSSAQLVSGSWGSGRLIRTSLVSVLVTSTGRVLIGAVTPAVLYHAATQPGRPLPTLGQHTASRARPK
ncbi:MAG: LolA family protein [Streptosporangiaceae bacterium]